MMVRVQGWERWPWLNAGFTTRLGGTSKVYQPGDLNLAWTKEDDSSAVVENRRRLIELVGGDMQLVTMRQVHGDSILLVRQNATHLETPEGRALLECDGLMTDAPGLLLGAQAADCVPVLLADTRLRAVAAVHAGWRGTRAGISAKALECMGQKFGTRAADVVAAVGPSIGPCCYAVGAEVRSEFEAAFPYTEELFEEREGVTFLDLWEANRKQLVEAGLQGDAVTVLGECSACSVENGGRRYFSHRAERGVTGRMMGVAGINR